MNKPSRTYEPWVNDAVKRRMDLLLAAAVDHATTAYREWMKALGGDLGAQLKSILPSDGQIVVVTTVEDADFLSQGVLGAIDAGERLRLFCYWNERNAERDIAPIISKYEEPLDEPRVSAVVVVKSVISGACVVRTNLTETLAKLRHNVPVFVVAPVMHADARKKLRREFDRQVADRFRFITCAIDSEKDGENVQPGIGGSVYELLGLGDKHTKNRVRPTIVAERSALHSKRSNDASA
jgi:hypothetical protein